jgi:chromate transporter
MMKDITLTDFKTVSFLNIAVIVSTWMLLSFTRIHSPIIVFVCLVLGWTFTLA